MQSNKGFSLMELSVVLVVIGLIVAMAIRMNVMIAGARVKAEMVKINKFENAAHNYYILANKLPRGTITTSDGSKIIDNNYLLELGLINKADTFAYFEEDEWVLMPCALRRLTGTWSPSAQKFVINNHWRYEDNVTNDLCLRTRNDALTSRFLICHIEHDMDDMSLNYGHGRYYGVQDENDYQMANPYADLTDCSAQKGKAFVPYSYKAIATGAGYYRFQDDH